MASHLDASIFQQGDEDVGRERNRPVQASLELGVDHPAGLQETPIMPLLAGDPSCHTVQHVGINIDEGPCLQETPQHKSREPVQRDYLLLVFLSFSVIWACYWCFLLDRHLYLSHTRCFQMSPALQRRWRSHLLSERWAPAHNLVKRTSDDGKKGKDKWQI